MSTAFARIMLLCICMGVLPLNIRAAPASIGITAGLMVYLEGLDVLTQGQFPEAVAAFSRTLETSGDDPDFVLVRGVADRATSSINVSKHKQRNKRLTFSQCFFYHRVMNHEETRKGTTPLDIEVRPIKREERSE